jgi:DNA-binding NtrC family response regulator
MSEKASEIVQLLVVSREPRALQPLWAVGAGNAWQLESVGNGWEAMERLQSRDLPDLLLLDLAHGNDDGLHMLRWLHRLRPELPIVLISDSDDPNQKREAIRLGASDYVVKPFDSQQVEKILRRQLSPAHDHLETEITSDDVEQVGRDAFFVSASSIMRRLRGQAELLAETNVPVLILGEAGSGKETVARLMHKLSIRSSFPFVKVSCAALPGELLEAELFGSERMQNGGRPKQGKLELCNRGTLLLDEIVELPIELQSRLMQVLQTGKFTRPSGVAVEVDVRILAATSANIERALAEKRLREDLYYLLSAFTLHVPALRQRAEEIPLLGQHFMHYLSKHYGLPPRAFSSAVLGACRSYSWPGNLRELESFVKRYLMMGESDNGVGPQDSRPSDEELENQEDGPESRIEHEPKKSASQSTSLKSLVQNVKLEAERNAISAALEKTGWNRKAAARLLKVSYRTLLYKIEQYHMTSSDTAVFSGGNGVKSNGNGNGNGNGFRGNGRAS